MSRRGVFVLGYPRTGTSATTAALAGLGLSRGTTETLKQAGGANERGFWEQRPLSHLNARILEHLGGGRWSAPPDLPPGWVHSPSIAADRDEGRRLFGEIFPTEPWVGKDPRNCLLLPFWMDLLELEPAVVLVTRHPLEAAASLERIDGPTKPLALASWERYMRIALVVCNGLPVLVSRYGDMVEDPQGWADEARAFLSRCGLADVEPETAAPEEIIDRRLRHCALDPSVVEDDVISSSQLHLHETLDVLTGAHPSFATPELPPETPHTEWLIAESRRADNANRRLREQLAAKLDAQARKLERLRRRDAKRAARERRQTLRRDRGAAGHPSRDDPDGHP